MGMLAQRSANSLLWIKSRPFARRKKSIHAVVRGVDVAALPG
jgi:hypothetical protein